MDDLLRIGERKGSFLYPLTGRLVESSQNLDQALCISFQSPMVRNLSEGIDGHQVVFHNATHYQGQTTHDIPQTPFHHI